MSNRSQSTAGTATSGQVSSSRVSSGHVIVVGAGIVGGACAWQLTRRGFDVTVVESERPGGGATAACMGHVVVMDDSEAQFALGRFSQNLWDELAERLPGSVERDPCGTLWVAEDDEEMAAVHTKHAFYQERGVHSEILDQQSLRQVEPELQHGLLGALRVPGDSVVYPPSAVEWMLDEARRLAEETSRSFELRVGVGVAKAFDQGVELNDGQRLSADFVVLSSGSTALDLLPTPLPGHAIRPRKGHLVITDRRPGFCRHQLVELGYLKSAHSAGDSSVAFNLQPRATGQMLLGSSRQFGRTDAEVEMPMIQRMVDRGRHFLPRLGELRAVRMWAGFRPATDDHLPLIGPVPEHPSLILAAGHEGLGITTSLGTAFLVAEHLTGAQSSIDPTPYLPSRAGSGEAHA